MAEIKRQVAVPLRIRTLKESRYVKQEGWEPNYIITPSEKKVSRVNLMGLVISSPAEDTLQIDDGTGSITVRQFDQDLRLTHLKPQDAVLIVGRPREYEREIYVIPEIVKKLKNPLWLKVRHQQVPPEDFSSRKEDQSDSLDHTSVKSETVSFREQYEQIYALIKDLDDGGGADIEEVLQQMSGPEAESIVRQLIIEGEVFEITPGKLKILH